MTEAISRLRALALGGHVLSGMEGLADLCCDLSLATAAGMTEGLLSEATLLAEDLEALSDRRQFGPAGHDMENLVEKAIIRFRSLRRAAAAAIRATNGALADIDGPGGTHFDMPIDLTPAFRGLPTVAQAEGRAIPTGLGTGHSGLGQVYGMFTAITCRAGRTSAPGDAVILPAGAMIRLDAGDAILLHHLGPLMKDGDSDPGQDEMRCSAVEAKAEGVEIHGPMVLSRPPAGLDLQIVSAAREQMPLGADDMDWRFPFLMIGAGIFYSCLALGELRDKSVAEFGVAMGGSLLFIVMAAILWVIEKRGRRLRRRMAPLASRALSLLRGNTTAQGTERDIEDLAESVVYEGGALNVFPPGYIVAGPGREVRVMRPLALLPAPAGENVVALRRKKPA